MEEGLKFSLTREIQAFDIEKRATTSRHSPFFWISRKGRGLGGWTAGGNEHVERLCIAGNVKDHVISGNNIAGNGAGPKGLQVE